MLWSNWLQAIGILSAIFFGALIFGLVIWRISKGDEENRRLREEGPNHPQASKYVGRAH
jgi:hypothetical protein